MRAIPYLKKRLLVLFNNKVAIFKERRIHECLEVGKFVAEKHYVFSFGVEFLSDYIRNSPTNVRNFLNLNKNAGFLKDDIPMRFGGFLIKVWEFDSLPTELC